MPKPDLPFARPGNPFHVARPIADRCGDETSYVLAATFGAPSRLAETETLLGDECCRAVLVRSTRSVRQHLRERRILLDEVMPERGQRVYADDSQHAPSKPDVRWLENIGPFDILW